MAAVSNVPDVGFARGIGCVLERPFHFEKTRYKPRDRAIYTIFYR
jgi:hypothetical protein